MKLIQGGTLLNFVRWKHQESGCRIRYLHKSHVQQRVSWQVFSLKETPWDDAQSVATQV